MDGAPRERVKDIFFEALERPAADREAFVAARCAGDCGLCADVLGLLAHDGARPAHFLEPEAAAQPEAGKRAALTPVRVGRYRVLRAIGEGGMGVVYEALQDHPSRTVALKLIRPGLGGEALVRRFHREAELLGQLQHPGIAQVYEAGVADVEFADSSAAGLWHRFEPGATNTPRAVWPAQPFLALEFVRGVALHDYLAQQQPALRVRLALFAELCDAVEHAHACGVVHRDLKPSNILVDAAGRPKVLDFGVARMTNADVQLFTVQTEAGQLLGTVPYMSPEQVLGDPALIGPRSDVYALGVMLYESLAGRLPYDVRGRPLPEAARLIREEEPSRLSSLSPELRGDIETIVAKALEKEAGRRYASAGALAADLRRFLRDEPVVARPPSALYQLRKFAKRNRTLVGGVVATLITLVIGVVTAGTLAVRENTVRHKAETSAAEARRLAYRSSLGAAMAALQSNNIPLARHCLEDAPADLRGWEWRYFAGRLNESLLALATGNATVWGATFSSDGTALLGIRDGVPPIVHVWAADSGAALGQLSAPEASALGLRAPRLRDSWTRGFLATEQVPLVRADGSAGAWRGVDWGVPPDTYLETPILAEDGVHVVFLTTVGQRKLGWVCALGDPHPVHFAAGAIDVNNILAVSHDAALVLEGSAFGATTVWDGRTGAAKYQLEGHTDRVMSAVFTPAGVTPPRIYTASWDTTVRCWDAATGAAVAVGHGHTNFVDAVAVSRNGRVVASASRDMTIRLWDAESLAGLAIFRTDQADLTSVAFSPDGTRLVSASLRGQIHVWDATRRGDPDVLRGHESYVYPLTFSPDGRVLASGGWDRVVRLWDVASERSIGVLPGHARELYDVAFSGDGSRLVSYSADGGIIVWDLRTQTELARRSVAGQLVGLWIGMDASGERVLLPVDRTSSARFWEWRSGREFDAPLAALTELRSPYVSPDRHWVAPTQGGVILSTRGEVPPLEAGATQMGHNLAAFSPDSRRVAVLADAHTVAVWDLEQRRVVARFLASSDLIYALAWHPDGSRLVVSGADGVIHVWNTETFEELAQLDGHRSYVWSLAFSPDGTTLASASGDHTVRLWRGLPRPGGLETSP